MSYCKLFVHAFTAVALFDLAYTQLLKAAVEAQRLNYHEEEEPTIIILSDCCRRKTTEEDSDEKDETGETETESKLEL